MDHRTKCKTVLGFTISRQIQKRNLHNLELVTTPKAYP